MILTGHGREINWSEKQRTLAHNTIEIEREERAERQARDSK